MVEWRRSPSAAVVEPDPWSKRSPHSLKRVFRTGLRRRGSHRRQKNLMHLNSNAGNIFRRFWPNLHRNEDEARKSGGKPQQEKSSGGSKPRLPPPPLPPLPPSMKINTARAANSTQGDRVPRTTDMRLLRTHPRQDITGTPRGFRWCDRIRRRHGRAHQAWPKTTTVSPDKVSGLLAMATVAAAVV